MARYQYDIALDLGSANVAAIAPGRGAVVCEPSVVAVHDPSGTLVTWGTKAMELSESNPGQYRLVNVVRSGVAARRPLALFLVSSVIQDVCGSRRVARARAILKVAAAPNPLELRAIWELAKGAGLKPAAIVEAPLVAALGWRACHHDDGAYAIADVGAGCTDIAVLRKWAVLSHFRLSTAMDCVDADIQSAVRNAYRVWVTLNEARRAREARTGASEQILAVRGRNIDSGLPCAIGVAGKVIDVAVDRGADRIANAIKGACCGMQVHSAMIAGGGALQRGLAARVAESLPIPSIIPPDPDMVAARGLAYVTEHGVPCVTNAAVGV